MSNKICQYTVDGELIKIWNNMKDVLSIVHDQGTLSKVLNGKGRLQTGGYVWRWYGDPFDKYKTPKKVNKGEKKGIYNFKKEVDKIVGDEYTVLSDKYVNNKTKLNIKHNKCGKTFYMTPSDFLTGYRCSWCGGTHKYTDKEFKNKLGNVFDGQYIAIDNYINYTTKIVFKHIKCGYEFKTSPGLLFRGHGCPKCSTCERYTQRRFEEVVHNISNGEYGVVGKYVNSHTKIKFINNRTGHLFEMRPYSFVDAGHRDPLVTQPKGEREIEYILKNKNILYKYQYTLHMNTRTLRPDFYLPEYKAFIEFDGQQHHKSIEFFGGEEGLRKTQERDALKNAYAYEHNIKMIRIPYYYLNNIEEFLEPFFANNEPVKKEV